MIGYSSRNPFPKSRAISARVTVSRVVGVRGSAAVCCGCDAVVSNLDPVFERTGTGSALCDNKNNATFTSQTVKISLSVDLLFASRLHKRL
ncbi:hypothetical protein [uncultured Sulfitobacter sp.]|uniref:hypothetical protein n=1 Tax=uncultured Sulfitobacter sp. TaxID=191468 RepID=UPI00261B8003|nr:hypothetical protein [uncultured Sulfitobacter sp.]